MDSNSSVNGEQRLGPTQVPMADLPWVQHSPNSFLRKSTSKSRNPWWLKLLKLTVFLTILTAIGAAGTVFWYVNKQIEAEGGNYEATSQFLLDPQKYVFGQQKKLNILCLGVDYNHTSQGIQHSKGARSDTIIILSLDAKTHKIKVLSIPRDLRVMLSDLDGEGKINSAFTFGGAKQSRAVVSKLLGVPIHYCVAVRVEAAKEIVDAMGGLTVNVEKDMDYDDKWGNLHIHLKKGKQKLNGMQVVGYCRFRHDEESDFGRMRRQQQVIRIVTSQLGKKTSLETVDRLAKIFRKNVTSDLAYSKMFTLGRIFRTADKSNIKTQSFAVQDDPSGGFDLLPVPEKNRVQIKEIFGE
jgi:LCP family protein required for cell wall assembly